MRKKLKLSFDRLEDTLTLISPIEAASVLGGNGSGLPENATFGEILSYFSDLGFTFAQDENGNYMMTGGGNYQGPAIMIDPVTVTGNSNATSNDSQYGAGLTSMLNRFLDERGGSETGQDDGSTGSDGSTVIITGGSAGGGTNTGGTTNNDPWKRENGKIVAVRTSQPPFNYNGGYGVTMKMEEYVIFTNSGAPITVYKAIGVVDSNGNVIRNASADERSNCIGYALTGGEYTFIDNPNTPHLDEGEKTRNSFAQWSGFVECTKEEASLVMIYSGTSSSSQIVHAGVINPDGSYSAKGGGGIYPIRTGMTEQEFFNPYKDENNNSTINYTPSNEDQVVYYRKAN